MWPPSTLQAAYHTVRTTVLLLLSLLQADVVHWLDVDLAINAEFNVHSSQVGRFGEHGQETVCSIHIVKSFMKKST